MAKPRIYKTEAVVVRQSPLGEADRVITMLSPEHGQIRAVAKGVRRSTGRLTGHLELLNRVEVSVAEGRNLDVVTADFRAATISLLKGNGDGTLQPAVALPRRAEKRGEKWILNSAPPGNARLPQQVLPRLE